MTKATRIADFADVIRGVSYDKQEVRDTPHDGLLPIMRAGNIGDSLDTEHDLVWVPSRFVSPKQRIRSGDIAICMSSGSASVVGKTAIAKTDWAGSVGAFCAILRPDSNKCLPAYLGFYLRSNAFRHWAREAQGANIKNIRKTDLENYSITLPRLAEQDRLVDILSRAEGIVRLHREALAKTREFTPALFVDMFGDPQTNPKGFPAKPLSEVASILSGVTKGRKIAPADAVEFPYMRVANVQDGHLDLSEIKRITVKANEVEKFRLAPGDLLMTEGGDIDKLGRAALWKGEIDVCLHQNHIFKVRCNKAAVIPEYLRALVGSRYGKGYFLKVAKRTTGIASINKTQLSGLPVLLPPISDQMVFADRTIEAESIQALNAVSLQVAQATFQSLLHRAFAGGI